MWMVSSMLILHVIRQPGYGLITIIGSGDAVLAPNPIHSYSKPTGSPSPSPCSPHLFFQRVAHLISYHNAARPSDHSPSFGNHIPLSSDPSTTTRAPRPPIQHKPKQCPLRTPCRRNPQPVHRPRNSGPNLRRRTLHLHPRTPKHPFRPRCTRNIFPQRHKQRQHRRIP